MIEIAGGILLALFIVAVAWGALAVVLNWLQHATWADWWPVLGIIALLVLSLVSDLSRGL